MLRMRFQSGIHHFLDLWLFFEPARKLERIRAMPLHSERERFQTSQHEKTVEGALNCPNRILQEPHSVAELLVFTYNCHAADHVGMAVQIFRRRMNHEIETKFDRPLYP